MKNIIPDPANYLNDIVDAVRYNITTDYTNTIRSLTDKVLGFTVGSFGRIEISDQRVDYIKSKIGADIIKDAENKIISMVEENLNKNITKAYIDQLTRDILDKVYRDVEDKMYSIVTEKITEIVNEKINDTLKTWLVAAKFVDSK